MPANAANIRFQGVDGRGRQELIRDPRNGGVAVVRIEDPSGGAEGYTFDILWGSGYGNYTQDRRPQYEGPPQRAAQPQYGGAPQYGGPPQYGGAPQYGGPPQYGGSPVVRGSFTADDAVRVCRNDIRERAAQRFGTPYLSFENMRMDDNPGRRDWVVGTFTLRRDRQLHQFACSVDFESGRVRSAQIDPVGGRIGSGSADRSYSVRDSIQNCEHEVGDRVRQRGLGNVEFGRVNVDDRRGRNDWVVGNVRGDREYRSESFDFSCQVDLRTGGVRTVDLIRR